MKKRFFKTIFIGAMLIVHLSLSFIYLKNDNPPLPFWKAFMFNSKYYVLKNQSIRSSFKKKPPLLLLITSKTSKGYEATSKGYEASDCIWLSGHNKTLVLPYVNSFPAVFASIPVIQLQVPVREQ